MCSHSTCTRQTRCSCDQDEPGRVNICRSLVEHTHGRVRMTGIIKTMFIISYIQYSGEVCSLGRIVEFCTGHVNVQKYYNLLYAELIWKVM